MLLTATPITDLHGINIAQTILMSFISFVQILALAVLPKYIDFRLKNSNTHSVEKAIPLIGKLRARLEALRDILNADRVYLVYYSNGERYYTGDPAQYCTILTEALNPRKPDLKSAMSSFAKIPISYMYRNLVRLHNSPHFTSPNDNLITDAVTDLNKIYDIVSLNGFKICVPMRKSWWQFWTAKHQLWVGTLYVAYDREFQMTEGEIVMVKTQLDELAIELVEAEKDRD